MGGSTKPYCSRCKQKRLLSEFPARGSVCKPCGNARLCERLANDPAYRKRENARHRVCRADRRAYRKRMGNSEKVCSRCKQKQLLVNFSTDGNICKLCRNTRRRVRRANDPEFRKRDNARLLVALHKRQTDPAYRKKINEQLRKRRVSDPEFRERMNEHLRRWRSNPINRKKGIEQQRVRRASPEARKERKVKRRRNQEHHSCQSAVWRVARDVMLPTGSIPEELKEAIILNYKSKCLLRKQKKAAKV